LDGESAFFQKDADYSMSDTMRHFVAGLIKYAPEYTYFLAPYINSYKRFAAGTFAPTKTIWSIDNRTAGFRLCGEGSQAVRIECRIGGSDINPYLAIAALLAAGIKGLEDRLELDPPSKGDVYKNDEAQSIPTALREATNTLHSSMMLREAMGNEVVEHYVRAASWEQEEFDRIVTDYEVARGFERA
ncbi:MAG: glutamine synthetase, partial [Pseudomonadota bacterium]